MILLWGSNARETHPIFFHHLLKGVRNGARLFVVDPRRTSSAQWADRWLGLDVGSDIALSNTMAREIIHAGLANRTFIENATEGYDDYAASVEPFTLAEGERLTGLPAEVIRETAHAFARADRGMICWTLGITEHHNAVDNVLSLINLALLCGHVGRFGSGLNPLRGQNNVQGGGDMGAIPNKLPGFQDIERDHEARARYEAAWHTTIRPEYGWHLTQMFHGMERGELRTLYVIGENPAQSEADITQTRKLLSELDFLVVQDIVLTRTAEMADVVFPSAASWCETDGTVTNSERRVQRTRKALDPPGEARDDMWIIAELARRLGQDWPEPVAEEVWDELRSLSPMHAGMSYARLEEHGGLQWPCPDESHPGSPILHERLWQEPLVGPPAPFFGRRGPRPVRGARRRVPDPAHDRPPARVVQHRRADEPLQLAAPPWRVSRPLAGGCRAARARRRRDRARVIAPRLGRGAAADRPVAAARSRVHDLPLPGPGRHEPADDRCHRSEVRHGRVQGRRDQGREARPGRARRARRRRRAGHRRRAGVMDLHLVPGAEPTAAESAALDHVLGAARDGWDGGERLLGPEGNTASTGHDSRARRHLLLPALWALQERIGWISPGGLNELCRRLTIPPADAYGVATFYAMLAVEPRPARVVHVCEDIACRCNGSDELIAQLEERFGGEGELSADGSTTWYRSPCLGQCDRAPAALVGDAGDEPARADARADDGRCRARRPRRWRARAGAGDRAAAGGRRIAAAASPRRLADRGQPRRVPRPRRLRSASARRRARPGRRDPGAEGLEAAGPGRRSLPDRRQVGGGRAPARAAALPRLQRRRVGARDVQGSRADGARSVRSDRGDDDRRLRDRLRAGVRLHPRRVPRATARARGRARRGAPARLPR